MLYFRIVTRGGIQTPCAPMPVFLLPPGTVKLLLCYPCKNITHQNTSESSMTIFESVYVFLILNIIILVLINLSKNLSYQLKSWLTYGTIFKIEKLFRASYSTSRGCAICNDVITKTKAIELGVQNFRGSWRRERSAPSYSTKAKYTLGAKRRPRSPLDTLLIFVDRLICSIHC